MKNMLIASKNISFIKKMNNSIDKEKITIINLCTKYDEVINSIKLYKPDFIIIELNLVIEQIYNIINISYIYEKNEPIIFISSNISLPQNFLQNNLYFFNKKLDVNYINDCLRYLTKDLLVENDENYDLEKKVLNEMLKMGFEMKNQGDVFLLEAIKYIKQNRKTKNDLKNDIYPAISKKLNIPISRIKWNIIYSINCTYSYKSDIMENYWKHDKKSKPTTKFVIFTILKNI